MGSFEECAALGCPNTTDKSKFENIPFHNFPLDPAKTTRWLLALNRTTWRPTSQSVLCSEHFRPNDFYKNSKCTRLKPNAIPSIIPGQSASKQKEISEIEQSPAPQENQNTRLNPSHNMKVVLVYESSSDDELILETYPEELSPAQLNFRNKHNPELEELDQEIKDRCNQPNVETLGDSFTDTSSTNRERKRSASKTSPKTESKQEPNRKPATNTSLLVPKFDSNETLHASDMVVAKPHLVVKEFTEDERLQLDTYVKTILSYPSRKFSKWLMKKGLLKSSQICNFHPSVPLKLMSYWLYKDVTSFPHAGGYLWSSDCCPDQTVSVHYGSLFESSPYPPSEILKLIYYWSCQTNFKDMVQFVQVDNSYIRLMNSRLRAICTLAVQTNVGLLGGPGKKVEIGTTTLMGTQLSNSNERLKVTVLGVLESETKQIRLCVLEKKFNKDKKSKKSRQILGFLPHWIHSESVTAIDTTMDKDELFSGGFTNIQQSAPNDQNPCNESIMKYLHEILPSMFESTLSLLTINVIQQFLDELVWRERYGTTPLECFNNIMLHISEQSDRFKMMVSRLAQVSADPLKNWGPKELQYED